MSTLKTPFRYDFVGSFLRPEYLKKARADYEAGTINAEELKKTEDKQLQNWLQSRRRQVITLLQTENSAVQHGIWILCGHLTESDTAKPKQDFRSTVKMQ